MHEAARERIADGGLRGIVRDERARDGPALARIERVPPHTAGLVDHQQLGVLVDDG
jgi:hypothetical protein